jgi:hypothetical protein
VWHSNLSPHIFSIHLHHASSSSSSIMISSSSNYRRRHSLWIQTQERCNHLHQKRGSFFVITHKFFINLQQQKRKLGV